MAKLSQLGLGCQTYCSVNGVFPPAFTNPQVASPSDQYFNPAPTTALSHGDTAPWTVRILPFIEDQGRYDKFRKNAGDFSGSYDQYPAINKAYAYTPNSAYQCPSHKNSIDTETNTDYFGVSGGGQWTGTVPAGKSPKDGYPWFLANSAYYFNNGAIVINGAIKLKDFTDGTSKQFLLGESRYQYTLKTEQAWEAAVGSSVWWVGRASRPSWAGTARGSVTGTPLGFLGSTSAAACNSINGSGFTDTSQYPGGAWDPTRQQLQYFGSYHPGGCHMAMVDGSVQFCDQTMDVSLFRRFGSREDGNPGSL